MEKRLIRILAPLVLDSNLSVQHAAIGALKNISLVDADICDQMIQQDVMTALSALLIKFANNDWKPEKVKLAKGAIDSKVEIFAEAVNVLWNLCEANDVALKIFCDDNLVEVLMKHTNLEMYGSRIVTPVLQCLYTISEDCKGTLLAKLAEHEHMIASLRLRPVDSPQDIHIQLLAHGIALNILQSKGEPVEAFMPELIGAIAKALDQDQRKLVHDFSSSIPVSIYEEETEAMDENSPIARHEVIRVDVNSVILAQQSALEMLTNICCDDSNDNWEETVSESDDSEIMEEMECSASSAQIESVSKISAVILEALKAHEMLPKVLAKAQLPAENVQEILNSPQGKKAEGPMVMVMVSTLQSRAFLCLNNFIESMTIEDLGGSAQVFEVWKSLGIICFAPGTMSDQVIEAATSAMRAATQKLCLEKSENFCNALQSSDEVQQMLEFGANHGNVSVRTNIVHIAGSLGQLLSLRLQTIPDASPSLILVAKFLLEAASRDVELRVVAEALDKIFDLFAEDYTDKLGDEVNLVVKLKQMMPGFKVKMNVHKRGKRTGDGETLAMASMANTNLSRFIKYKEKRAGNGHHANGK